MYILSNNNTMSSIASVNTSYVIAVIRLPLEVHPDGTFTALNDNIDFEFIPIKELPPKKVNGMELASIELDEIIGLFTNTKPKLPPPTDVIRIDKIHKRIRNKNTTFKNNVGSHNYTSKSWR